MLVAMAKAPSDRYVRMYGPLLDVLRELGGEASPREASRLVADKVLGGTPERDREIKGGVNAAENEVAWARNNLREAGLIDGSVRGTWKLTEEGWKTHFNLQQAQELGRNAKIKMRKQLEAQPESEDGEIATDEDESPGLSLIDTIKALPHKGFERLCQRILRELGFAEVKVTGRSNDGGIDGTGVLQVNELISFQVIFQCKRYAGSVGAPEIRNFRGAMTGRTDKGIFMTTGVFTADAQREAFRDGVPPVELVDASRLVTLMEDHLLGVTKRTVYDVDDAFFALFRTE